MVKCSFLNQNMRWKWIRGDLVFVFSLMKLRKLVSKSVKQFLLEVIDKFNKKSLQKKIRRTIGRSWKWLISCQKQVLKKLVRQRLRMSSFQIGFCKHNLNFKTSKWTEFKFCLLKMVTFLLLQIKHRFHYWAQINYAKYFRKFLFQIQFLCRTINNL